MKFSKESVEMLIDLIEIKISNLIVQDRDDTKELKRLKKCRNELQLLLESGAKSNSKVAQKAG